ncbi:conserved exported hypothetical protein [Bradyrhizobium oligotrophicum S58]|uniref:DUF3616 domain-containing protein n=1 Tax=Bradyrhizobium oligotrophicum S58 TaxID=1245469 RepID=M4ZGD5_9BRAD|nr:DUF3616 domain-containing protein [Bradyrhizobium oligotrophicum]BAM92868.1 conserved exported hypothetical protein [Bradyrhizobium oligotrophicum S58]
MRLACLILTALMVLDGGTSWVAAQSGTIPLTRLDISGTFLKEPDKTAKDLSGIACLAPQQGRRNCLLINDESRAAQRAVIENDRITAGAIVELIGEQPSAKTLGTAPDATCKKKDDFEDLDGEGVAYADPYFYIVGSHGCSRKKDKFRLSSFILARVNADPAASGQAETTYRVSDLLRRATPVDTYFAKDLESENGLNIEGVAAQGDRLWFGLRAPVVGDNAYLVSAVVSDLFAAGHEPGSAKADAVPVRLDGRGIRDLAALPDGRLLVLAGAPHGPEVPFKLFAVEPASGASEELGTLAPVAETIKGETVVGKAEALAVLEASADRVTFVVLFDSLPNGAPHRGQVDLPKRNRN